MTRAPPRRLSLWAAAGIASPPPRCRPTKPRGVLTEHLRSVVMRGDWTSMKAARWLCAGEMPALSTRRADTLLCGLQAALATRHELSFTASDR